MICLAALGAPNPVGLIATTKLLVILRKLHNEPTMIDMGQLFFMLACATLAWALGAGVLVGVVMMLTGAQLTYNLAADSTEREVRFLLLASAFVHTLNAVFTGVGLLTLSDGDCVLLSTECYARLGSLPDASPHTLPIARLTPGSQSPRGTPRSPVVGTAVADPVRVWPTPSEQDAVVVLHEAERARRLTTETRDRRATAELASLEQLINRLNLHPQLLDPSQRGRFIEALEEIERRRLRCPLPRFQDRFERVAPRALETV